MIKLNAFGTTKGGLSSKYWLSYVRILSISRKVRNHERIN